MSTLDLLTGPERGPKAGGAPQELVIFLHGLGADGNDLIALAEPLGDALPNAAFLAPDAPFACDMAPTGRQWFSLQDLSPVSVFAGLRRVAPAVHRFLDGALARFGVSADRCALLGFSQGTMLALHVGMRRAEQLGCIVGYSGALVLPEVLPDEAASRPPVLLVHGTDDPIVPFEAMGAAVEGLGRASILTHSLSRPGLGHGIDPEGLMAGAGFLIEHLSGEHQLVTQAE